MVFSSSLKKNSDFQTLYQEGKSFANKELVLYVRINHTNQNRFGISISKKVGNSVVRHRFARQMREIYRLNERSLNRGIDLSVIARGSVRDLVFVKGGTHTLERAFLNLVKKAHLFINENDIHSHH